jgi:hypothetical protein
MLTGVMRAVRSNIVSTDFSFEILKYLRIPVSSRAIRRGDFLLFDHPSNSNCGVIYRVKSIEFQSDPRDMFFAEIEFCKHTFPEHLRDATAITRGDIVCPTDIPKEFKDLSAPYQ